MHSEKPNDEQTIDASLASPRNDTLGEILEPNMAEFVPKDAEKDRDGRKALLPIHDAVPLFAILDTQPWSQ